MTDTNTAAATLHARVSTLVHSLQDAWNRADSHGFAAPFGGDADFVNVYGMHARGRDAIQQGHEFILKGPYAGSTNRYTLESVRVLRPGVAVAHVHAALAIPAGPMAGEHQARYSMVLVESGGEWEIASFHNTFIAPPR